MTDEELEQIARRWDGGSAQVDVDFGEGVGAGDPLLRRMVRVSVPHSRDVPTLVAEVRRLRAALESCRDDSADAHHHASKALRVSHGPVRLPGDGGGEDVTEPGKGR